MGLAKQSLSRLTGNGSILIIALWSLCFLSTYVVILSQQLRQKITLVSRLDQRDRLNLIADAAVKKAIAELKKAELKPYDSLNDGLSNEPAVFKDVFMNSGEGSAKFSITYDFSDQSPSGDKQSGSLVTRYGLIDEESKININKAGQALLERFFKILLDFDELKAQELAACIIDWRDSDSELSIPLGSAEDSYYTGLRYSYEAKDADFQAMEELFLVKGMDEQLFEKLKPYITIYGSGRVNLNTASGVVLAALGIDEALLSNILSFRSGEDKLVGSADDNIFTSSSDILPKLKAAYQLSEAQEARLNAVIEQSLVVSSNHFMVSSVAQLNKQSHKPEGSGAASDSRSHKPAGSGLPSDRQSQKTDCVINRKGKLLSWHQP
jgi:type II secretory pathway component PulK